MLFDLLVGDNATPPFEYAMALTGFIHLHERQTQTAARFNWRQLCQR